MYVLFSILQSVLGIVQCLGPLPDASQEGLLWPWKGYSSVALFHYHVPAEATRATWEFASFQDQPDCPKRRVHVWIQHGSYPVINASSTQDFPPHQYFVERSHLDWLTLESAYKPSETLVHPIYAPLSGKEDILKALKQLDGNTFLFQVLGLRLPTWNPSMNLLVS